MRGGGSLQSLAAFDNEVVARKVSSYPIPVIAAIGHHVDVPLAAMVADKAVSTPTAAAGVLSESWNDAKNQVEKYEGKILSIYDGWIDKSKYMITRYISNITDGLGAVFDNYKKIERGILVNISKVDTGLLSIQNSLKENGKSIVGNLENTLQVLRDKFENISKLIESNNPLRQLGLGYSIVSSDGKIIKGVGELTVGEIVGMLFSDGKAQSEIIKLMRKKGVVK